MHPEPPHLSVALYHPGPEGTTLARVCAAVESVGWAPGHEVTLIPAGREFGYLFEVADVAETVQVTPRRYAELLAGRDPEVRVVRARYEHRSAGLTVVGYQPGPGAGPHPVAVEVSAGALGLPDFVRSDADRQAARALAARVTGLLEAVTRDAEALYGTVAVEEDLPTPAQLTGGRATLATPAFVSRRLLAADEGLAGRLRGIFGAAGTTEWEHGVLVSAWAPFRPAGAELLDPQEARRQLTEALRPVLAA